MSRRPLMDAVGDEVASIRHADLIDHLAQNQHLLRDVRLHDRIRADDRWARHNRLLGSGRYW